MQLGRSKVNQGEFYIFFLLICLIISSVLNFSSLPINYSDTTDDFELIKNPESLFQIQNSFIDSEPIVAYDEHLPTIATRGSGTEEDPYVIENLKITTPGRAIHLGLITKHILIQNCWISSYKEEGIYIYYDNDQGGIQIKNNFFVNNDVAIKTGTNHPLKIINNSFINNDLGLDLYGASNALVEENNFIGGKYLVARVENTNYFNFTNNNIIGCSKGLYLENSHDVILTNNYCFNSQQLVFYLDGSYRPIIKNNTFKDCIETIQFKLVSDSVFENNVFLNCGLILSDFPNFTSFANNSVNNLPLKYYINEENISIKNCGQVILEDCVNVTIENEDFSNSSIGIIIISCQDVLLNNNTCNNGFSGIRIIGSTNVRIINNECNNNREDGIYISGSSNANIVNNSCLLNSIGINLCSWYSNVVNNTCNFNVYGIVLDNADYSTIENCNVFVNLASGIQVKSNSVQCSIINSSLIKNNRWGIDCSAASTITNCTFRNNGDQPSYDILNPYKGGLRLYASNSQILNNDFVNDGLFLEGSLSELLSNKLTDNLVNNLPLGIFNNTNDLTIASGYGQLIIINCSRITIKNQNYSNSTVGVSLYYSDNCNINNISCHNNDMFGIYSIETNVIDIMNSFYHNNNHGIYLDLSSNITATDNICDNNIVGIYIDNAEDVEVTNNYCMSNFGIHLRYSSANITGNVCNKIYVYHSDSSLIRKNICYNKDDFGIRILYSYNCIVENNTLFNCGFGFDYSHIPQSLLTATLTDNFVNNKPLGIFIDKHDETINLEYGQLIFYNSTSMSISNQNYSSATIGIAIYHGSNFIIKNNTCLNNSNCGIRITHCPNSIIEENFISFSSYNLYASICDNLLVKNNVFNHGGRGIYIDTGESLVIEENKINNNDIGLNLKHSISQSIIRRNSFRFNSEYAVEIWAASDNQFHHNIFFTQSRILDDGSNNIWYENQTNEGNWWFDHMENDSYIIEGLAGSLDKYPLPHLKIVNPQDGTYSLNNILFTYSDPFGIVKSIYIDSNKNTTAIPNGSIIELSDGEHNFTIIGLHPFYNTKLISTVIFIIDTSPITTTQDSSSSSSPPAQTTSSIGSLLVILITVTLCRLKKKKKIQYTD